MLGNKYKAEVERLSAELANAKEELKNLRQEKDIIEEQRNGLVHERDELKEQRDIISKKKEYVEEQRNGLVHERDALKEQNSNLVSEKEELRVQYEEAENDLRKRGQATINDYKKLQEDYNRLMFNAESLSQLHEDVVRRKWTGDDSLKNYTCLVPFQQFDIYSEGDVYCCCCQYAKHGFCLGNIYEKSFDELWNHEHAQKLRYCASMGEFEYCNNICATLHSKPEDDMNLIGLPPIQYRKDYPFEFKSYKDCVLDYGPKYIKLECDITCNLSCPSCRSEVKGLNAEQSERVYQMLMREIYPNLGDCELLTGLCSGELLASKALMRFYKHLSHEKFPKIQLLIYSNGMLLDEKHFMELSNLKGMPIILSVSVDAVEKETYEAIRRGANWEKLNANMAFVKSLLNSEEWDVSLRLNFCVQKANYLQLPQFMELAKEWGASIVALQLMTDWGTMPMEEYIENNVVHEDNPHRQEALRLVKEATEIPGITVVTNIL